MTTQIEEEDAPAAPETGSGKGKKTGSPAKWKWLPEPLFNRPVAIGAVAAAAAVAVAGLARRVMRRRGRD